MGNWIQSASGIWTTKAWMGRPNRLEPETLAYMASNPNVSRDWWEIDTNIKSIKYGSGITLSSVTAKLSTVDGTAFVTQPSVDLRPYLGFIAKFSDGSKYVQGAVKAAGTGETLGSELVTNGTFDSETGWTLGSGWSIAGGKAVFNAEVGSNLQQQITESAGGLYTLSVTCDSRNTGSYSVEFTGSNVITTNTSNTATTTKTAGSATSATLKIKEVNSGNGIFDDFSVKQVLSPSATGVTIVSAIGGTTYNWATKETDFNPDAASFTVTITRS